MENRDIPFPFRFSQIGKQSNFIVAPTEMYESITWDALQELETYIEANKDSIPFGMNKIPNVKTIAKGVNMTPVELRDELERRGMMNLHRFLSEFYPYETYDRVVDAPLPFPFRLSKTGLRSSILLSDGMDVVSWEQLEDLNQYLGMDSVTRRTINPLSMGAATILEIAHKVQPRMGPTGLKNELNQRGLMNLYRIMTEKGERKRKASVSSAPPPPPSPPVTTRGGSESMTIVDAPPSWFESGYSVITPPPKRPAFCPLPPSSPPSIVQGKEGGSDRSPSVSFFSFDPILFSMGTGTGLSPPLQPGSLECSPSIIERSPSPPQTFQSPQTPQTPQGESSEQMLRGLDEMIFGKKDQQK